MYRFYYFAQTDFICLVILLLILIIINKKSVVNNSLLMFKKTIISCIFFCILDCIIYVLQGYNYSLIKSILLISNTLYFWLFLLISHYWNKFVNTKILYNTSYIYKFISEYFFLTLGSIFLIVNIFNPCIFLIDNSNIFLRYNYMSLFLFICWFSIIISIIKLFFNYFKITSIIEKKESISMMLFIIAPFICNVIQLFNSDLSLTQVGLTISMLLIFLDYQHRLISLDSLTGINNRTYLNEYIDNLYRNASSKSSLSVFIIDIDKFKTINDTYGHETGDRILKSVSLALRNACDNFKNDLKLSRYGGDEFMIVGNIKENDVSKFITDINNNIKDIKISSNKNVTVSIGYVLNKKIKEHPFRDLYIMADENMYENKQKKS